MKEPIRNFCADLKRISVRAMWSLKIPRRRPVTNTSTTQKTKSDSMDPAMSLTNHTAMKCDDRSCAQTQPIPAAIRLGSSLLICKEYIGTIYI